MIAGPRHARIAELCRRPRDRPERVVDDRQRFLRQPLDEDEKRPFRRIAKRQSDAVRSGASGAPDAMDVALRQVRQIVVDDVADAVDIDAARGDVGGNEHPQRAVAQAGNGALARVLRFVAVDGIGVNPVPRQLFGNAIGAMLGTREHQRPRDGGIFEQSGEQRSLVAAVDKEDALIDALDRGGGGRHLHPQRIAKDARAELRDLVRHGRGKAQ